MEISKETYLRFRAADNNYAQFFDKFRHSSANLGFCSMMRTIYFWRPFIATTRLLLMTTTVAVACGAFYFKSTEVLAGVAVFSFLALLVWMAKIVFLASGDFFDSEEKPLVFQWAKASHDKVCPLVTFTEEENATNS